jgi:hypothetical protein
MVSLKPCLLLVKRGFRLLWRGFGIIDRRVGVGKWVEGRLRARLSKHKKDEFLLNRVIGKALIVLIALAGVLPLNHLKLAKVGGILVSLRVILVSLRPILILLKPILLLLKPIPGSLKLVFLLLRLILVFFIIVLLSLQ